MNTGVASVNSDNEIHSARSSGPSLRCTTRVFPSSSPLLPGIPLFYLVMLFASLVLQLRGVVAAEFQSHDEIRMLAETHVHEYADSQNIDAQIELGQIDPRLNLASCSPDLQVYFASTPGPGGNALVGVRCTGPKPWNLHIPVKLRSYQDVLVLTRNIASGMQIHAGDIEIQRKEVSSLRQTPLTDASQIDNQVVKRALTAGTVLTESMLVQAQLIKRGDPVTITIDKPGILIQAPGEALQNGTAGGSIPVRNLLSKLVIHAVVEGPGAVRVQ
jgi:flagella basal body P-ring formation protein FlgA